MMQNLKVSKHHWIERATLAFGGKMHECDNIVAEITGLNYDPSVIILCAHYDCDKLDSPGALDNGCGIASLLSIAKALSIYQFDHTIRFIAFSGEELRFLGSYAYAKEMYNENEKISAVFNMDVIGNNTYSTTYRHKLKAFSCSTLYPVIEELNFVNQQNNINIFIEERNYYGNSDDKPFNDYGFPSLQFFQSGNQMQGYFGKANDTIDLINFTYLKEVSWSIAASIYFIAGSDLLHPQIYIDKPKEDALYICDWKLFPSSKGRTIINGPITVNVKSISDNIEKVEFQLISGHSEYITSNGEEFIYTQYTDDSYPFEWKLNEKCFGFFTIRVISTDNFGIKSFDEIEVFTLSLGIF